MSGYVYAIGMEGTPLVIARLAKTLGVSSDFLIGLVEEKEEVTR
jgi:hypothetical protein